jgi:phosphate transport system substrate-binding protein
MDDDHEAPPERPSATLPLTRRVPLLWTLVAIAIAALTATAAIVLLRAERGPRPGFLDAPPASGAAPAAPRSRGGTLLLAGSGSNLPLTRALVIAFLARHREAKIVVPESIGSSGGVRALRDGAIDVGLISRPLTADEAKLGLTVTPYARVPVVVAANPSVRDECVASSALLGMWAGAQARWSDGSRVIVLQRERNDSGFLAVSRRVPGLDEENTAAYRETRWRVLYDDHAMQEALMATENAVGIFDLGAIIAQRLPIRALCVDGVAPSIEGVVAGTYPYFKDLAFVTSGPSGGLRAELLAFVASREARDLAASLGYLPLPMDEPAPSADGGAP